MSRSWLVLVGLLMTSDASAEVIRTFFGKTATGEGVDAYTLRSATVEATVITYGARLVRVRCPDRSGKPGDVVLGYDTVEAYEQDRKTYLGAIVGRYGNRIGRGGFTIDGKRFQVPTNNGKNALHGGSEGFDRKLWTARQVPGGVEMTLISPDGDMGFPGKLTTRVTYTLEGDSLRVAYAATSDKPTVVNLTNHAYFNLHADQPGDVLGHELELVADRYTPVDDGLIPTGELASVAGTPFDFRKPTPIGKRIGEAHEQLRRGRGYDHNWVLNGTGVRVAARVHDPQTGRVLTVKTSEPGVQFYSGNFLDGSAPGRHGPLKHRNGFCLETQHFPDSPNRPAFPSTLLRPGETRTSETTFSFTVQR